MSLKATDSAEEQLFYAALLALPNVSTYRRVREVYVGWYPHQRLRYIANMKACADRGFPYAVQLITEMARLRLKQ